MILEAHVVNEKKFSNSPILGEDIFDMDGVDVLEEATVPEEGMVSSSNSNSQSSVTDGSFLCDPSSSMFPYRCNELDMDSDDCSLKSLQNDIIARRNKSSTAPFNGNLPRLRIEKTSKEPFLKYFGLVPNSKEVSIIKEHKDVTDIDCEIIAVEGLDHIDNVPMTSPRTPHSLMSQLSRDHEGSSRKRLFSLSGPVSDTENQSDDILPKTSFQGSLLGIDFSSFLGQRVRKHVKADSSMHVIKSVESYCTTTWIKNDFVEKLRFRQSDYPVTFRKKKKGSNRHRRCHEYKFNSMERREFMKVARTGLNKEGRRLKRQMKKLTIRLKRLSEDVIEEWTKPKPITIWIDDDISIVEVEPPPGITASFSGQNFPNRFYPYRPGPATYRNAFQPKRFCEPRPQYLVKKVDKQLNGFKSREVLFYPLNEDSNKTHSFPKHAVHRSRNLGPASRRKQNFSQLRTEMQDDSISIRSLSSDEDDNILDSNPNGKPKPNGSLDQKLGFPFNYGVNSHSQSSSNQSSSSQFKKSKSIHNSSLTKQSVPKVATCISSTSTGHSRPQQIPTSNPSLKANIMRAGTSGNLAYRLQSNYKPERRQSFSQGDKVNSSSALNHNVKSQELYNLLVSNNNKQPINTCTKQQQVIANNSTKKTNSGSSSPLTIASVYSLSGKDNETPLARVNIEIGQIGSLTGGSNDSPLVFPTGIKANQFVTNSIPIPPLPPVSKTKMAEYIVERNIDSDTNEVVEIICIEDDS
ncbi:hypothetical protein SNE40_015269 [Patella caerulea]|uniref:Uncharacterized protein n=1 Tax=Patella caerulea TaxID=87958 RepID=A0AAN8JKS2_PATCE